MEKNKIFEYVKILDQTQKIRNACPKADSQLLTPLVTPKSFFCLDEKKIVQEIECLGKILPIGTTFFVYIFFYKSMEYN